MWVKKYAPQSFDDVVGNAEIVARFKSMCDSGYMQHMILCGPPGVGKNTLLHLLMRHMLKEQYKDGTLLFGSPDNKSNQHVRDKIHQFVPKKMANDTTKFVVFKQAELLSEGVQQVMRRMMEQHYHHTVFVFVCNSIGNLLETIQSRCHIYRFKHIGRAEQVSLLKTIAQREGKTDKPDIVHVYEKIANMSNGDMRFSLNYFQVYCASQQCTNACLFPYFQNVADLFQILLDTESPHTVTNFHRCVSCLRELFDKGYCGRDIVMFLNDYIVSQDARVPRGLALEWMKHIALCQYRMKNGADSFLQICGMLSTMYMCKMRHVA